MPIKVVAVVPAVVTPRTKSMEPLNSLNHKNRVKFRHSRSNRSNAKAINIVKVPVDNIQVVHTLKLKTEGGCFDTLL